MIYRGHFGTRLVLCSDGVDQGKIYLSEASGDKKVRFIVTGVGSKGQWRQEESKLL